MKNNQGKIEITEEQLRQMSEEKRKALFGGKDPLTEMGGVSTSALSLAVAIALSLVIGFFLVVQFVIQPSVVPDLKEGSFALPLEENHPVLSADRYQIARGYWNTRQYELFIESSQALQRAGILSDELAALKELHRYTVRALIFTEAYEQGREYIQLVQSRYPDDRVFMSDLFYYRGHIILKTRSHADAFGAFHEADALGGRYAEEAKAAKEKIQSINSPLW